jgi:hypothetical protein
VSIDRINLRGPMSDHTVSLGPPRRSDRVWLNLTADHPLECGYEETGVYLDEQSLGRLLHWLQTGEALPRDDPRIPKPFGDAS